MKGEKIQQIAFVSNLKLLTNATHITKFRKITCFITYLNEKKLLIFFLCILLACILSISSFNSLAASFPTDGIEG